MSCPNCGSSEAKFHARAHDIEYFTSSDPYDFLHCERCDILYIAPMLSDKLSDIYPGNYYSFVSGKKSVAVKIKEYLDRRKFGKILKGINGETVSILDVGGGTGWLVDLMKAADARVNRTTIVDIDPAAEAVARSKGHHYFCGRFEDYDSTDRFDIILMLNLIEHVANPRDIFSKAAHHLKDGGFIVLKTPNFKSLDARIFRHRSWAGYHTPRHFVLFCHESLSRLADECGLRVERFNYTQGAPFWSISLFEELRRLGLVKADRDHPAIYHPLVPWLQMLTAALDFIRQPFAKLSQMEFILSKKDVQR